MAAKPKKGHAPKLIAPAAQARMPSLRVKKQKKTSPVSRAWSPCGP
jgi:hypothetical protein